MAKESIHSIDKHCIFRETFNSEADVRRNGGVPTQVDFSEGIATPTSTLGRSSSIIYSGSITKVPEFTIRVRVRLGDDTNIDILNSAGITASRLFVSSSGLGCWLTGGFKGYYNGSKLIRNKYLDIVITVNSSSTKYYIDGENVFSGSGESNPTQIGNWYFGEFNSSDHMDYSIDLCEIYDYALSAEEVSNLYNNSRYKQLRGTKTLLHLTAENGVIEDKAGNTITNKGSIASKSGSISAIAGAYLNTDLTLSSFRNKTYSIWIYLSTNLYLLPISSTDYTFFRLYVAPSYSGGNTNLQLHIGDGVNYVVFYQTLERKYIYEWFHVCYTVNNNGDVYFYINGHLYSSYMNKFIYDTYGPISRLCLYFTNEDKLNDLRIIDGVLTAEQVSQLYTSEKHKYGK